MSRDAGTTGAVPDNGTVSDHEPSDGAPPVPRWVRVVLVVLGVLVVLVAVLLLTGEHGPSRHGASTTPVPSVEVGS